MNQLRNHMLRLLNDESGQDLIEYALIAGLIGAVSVAAITGLQTSIAGMFTSIQGKLTLPS